jgi:hypothetical protein
VSRAPLRGLALLALLVTLATTAAAAPKAKPPRSDAILAKLRQRWRTQLVEALARRSPVALERAAQQLGPAQLLLALRGKDRAYRRAAIAAAPLTRRPWTLLPALLRRASAPDRSEAVAAARAARAVAEKLRAADLQRYEESPATLRPTLVAFLSRAGDPRVSPDLRVAALLTAAALGNVVPLRSAEVKPLLADRSAAIRRAAVELTSGDDALVALLLPRLAGETEPSVRRAIAAAFCARQRRGGKAGRAARATLRQAGWPPLLQALAQDPKASRDELIDVGRCLRLLPDRASRRAANALRKRLRRRRKTQRARRRSRR